MGLIKIKKVFFRFVDFFLQISQKIYKKNQWLKIDILTILDLLNMMDGSDLNCGTNRVGFQRQNRDQYITASEFSMFTFHAETVNCRRSTISRFLPFLARSTMNQDAKS